MMCFASFVGFEATTIYSKEARTPHRTIPLATRSHFRLHHPTRHSVCWTATASLLAFVLITGLTLWHFPVLTGPAHPLSRALPLLLLLTAAAGALRGRVSRRRSA